MWLTLAGRVPRSYKPPELRYFVLLPQLVAFFHSAERFPRRKGIATAASLGDMPWPSSAPSQSSSRMRPREI
jgi:hypothetical protein